MTNTLFSRIPVLRSMEIFVTALWRGRKSLPSLVKWDFKRTYLGSFIGLAWALLKPLAYMSVLGFALKYGFGRSSTSNGIPIHIWLICGLLPWMYITDAITGPISSITEYDYLVKKVKFNVSLIPFAKVVSSLLIHILLVVLFCAYLLTQGRLPTVHWIQIPYLMASSTLFLSALSWLSASMYVFVRDIGPVISIAINLAIWVTPVFWSEDSLPSHIAWVVQLNPLTYIVEGYRDALLQGRWVFGEALPNLSFWIVTLSMLVASMLVFRRLNNHFADVI